MTVCYINEATEGQELILSWDFLEEGIMQVDGHRQSDEKLERIFSAKLLF